MKAKHPDEADDPRFAMTEPPADFVALWDQRIRERSAAIRDSWTAEERQRRLHGTRGNREKYDNHYSFPEVKTCELRLP